LKVYNLDLKSHFLYSTEEISLSTLKA
jgi:hypothetical protein